MGPKKAAGDATKGEKVFKNLCAVCHAMGSHGTGPNLKGVAGRAVASADGFAYSSALTGKGGKWTDKNLDKYLKSPADWAPGNAMAFAGIANAKERGDVVAYLKANSA
uniref:Cytochrome c domain-containing protein n=1 Tax=Strombidium rassoulzadegani TaxID=1082188 RepID=A0A7S3FV01_9SPIT|mmetsp:Transcript_3457/g.5877  ORF Transcript_3457/g.5877 Transcript_3457/m.5877 type:complete len:108 (+) Transcript_3457:52-375(+)|eukprot:CAMPEP_0168607512 /NCGR_PEP_ID=MMETSP0449_2-20121227/93_1 /TAXON_ID=1082188 /ORGANISM="Strombidium rassoulzadegani, Strain ras09" /LENGTH=107 /DNA_ID=CAMNT_0008647355 /DNA_START=31 /DNA_END=354 /DNA_ORIENTATION=+